MSNDFPLSIVEAAYRRYWPWRVRVAVIEDGGALVDLVEPLRQAQFTVDVTSLDRMLDWQRPPNAVIVGPDPGRTLARVVERVRRELPHVPCLVLPGVVLPLVERCRLYDLGAAHVVEPPVAAVEVAARIRATQVDAHLARLTLRPPDPAANPREKKKARGA